MNPIRFGIIKRGILDVLNECEGFVVPTHLLHQQLNLSVIPPATQSEFDEVLGRLDTAKLIKSIRKDDIVKWSLTETGQMEITP